MDCRFLIIMKLRNRPGKTDCLTPTQPSPPSDADARISTLGVIACRYDHHSGLQIAHATARSPAVEAHRGTTDDNHEAMDYCPLECLCRQDYDPLGIQGSPKLTSIVECDLISWWSAVVLGLYAYYSVHDGDEIAVTIILI